MGTINNYRDLRIWKEGMRLTKEVYIAMDQMPNQEMYGLTSQIKRAAVSIPSNIAEGQVRSTKEFIHFLKIARGSLAELDTQLTLTTELKMLEKEPIQKIQKDLESLAKQINSLIKKLKTK